MKKPIKNFAIIGSNGFVSNRHKKAIRDNGGKVVCTCDIDAEADFYDYRNMIDSIKDEGDVDAISICTPNHLHAEHVRACLTTGLPVLCEKPLITNTDFTFMDDVYVVSQLRYHPLFDEICAAMVKAKKIKIVLKAIRNEEFWKSWKGDEAKSGGCIYVMGAHIFDLLLCAFKDKKYKFEDKHIYDRMKKSFGYIYFDDIEVDYEIELLDNRDGQTRHLEIDGKKYVLSLKDNLSFDGLHDQVYKAFIDGTAPKMEDIKPSIELIDKLKKAGR